MHCLRILGPCLLALTLFGCNGTTQQPTNPPPDNDGSGDTTDNATTAPDDASKTGTEDANGTDAAEANGDGGFKLNVDIGDGDVRVEGGATEGDSGVDVDVDPPGPVDVDVGVGSSPQAGKGSGQ